MKDWFKQKEPTLPKKLSENEQHAVEIIQHLISRKESHMYYDPEKFEWYIEVKPYLVVIESGKVVIFNTKLSHEVRLEGKTELYLSHICSREISKRRQQMKATYESKVENNLGVVLSEVKKLP